MPYNPFFRSKKVPSFSPFLFIFLGHSKGRLYPWWNYTSFGWICCSASFVWELNRLGPSYFGFLVLAPPTRLGVGQRLRLQRPRSGDSAPAAPTPDVATLRGLPTPGSKAGEVWPMALESFYMFHWKMFEISYLLLFFFFKKKGCALSIYPWAPPPAPSSQGGRCHRRGLHSLTEPVAVSSQSCRGPLPDRRREKPEVAALSNWNAKAGSSSIIKVTFSSSVDCLCCK